MWDMTARGTGFRSYTAGGSRGTVASIDTSHLMQTMMGTMFQNDQRSGMEHFEGYGNTAAIIAQTAAGVAEALMSHVTGARAHAIAGVIGDRRFRPRGFQQGETAQYDDIGQMTYAAREALYMLSHDGPAFDGTTMARFASLRHVVKQQQPPIPSGGVTPEFSQQQEAYQHEGQSVNTEVRADAKRIHIFDGETEVGYYDKASTSWVFIAGTTTSCRLVVSPQGVKMKDGGNVIFVDGSGCWTTQPIMQKADPIPDGSP